MIRKLRTFWHPERFQGWRRRRNYFEGWYFKVVSEREPATFAIIPGLAYDGAGDGHAFIQVLDGRLGVSAYHRFPIDAFSARHDLFEVAIGENFFSEERLNVHLPDFRAELRFGPFAPWPTSILSPGIMGPYAFAPFMQCYHGIVSMDHEISGTISAGQGAITLVKARGYIEKDWGSSFPSAYIWMQSNHFDREGISIKASVAKIPWMGSFFIGFIAGVWIEGELYQFTTYNKTELVRCVITQKRIQLALANRAFLLDIDVERHDAVALASPIRGAMEGRIDETMNASLHVTLREAGNGSLVFEGTGTHGGLDVAGDVELLETGTGIGGL